MIKSTSLAVLFLIAFASTAQVSNTIFSNNRSQQRKLSTIVSNQRTATVNKQRLDSIVSPIDKYIYTYDVAGNQIRRVRYEWDNVSKSWIPYNRFEDKYDAVSNAILTEEYAWDDINNVYVQDYKYEREYDLNKNQTSQITYSWYGSPANWHPLQKSVNTFGSNGKISSTYNYSWAESVLMVDNYIEFTYNSKNLLVLENKFIALNTLESKKTYTYNASDNVISEVVIKYDMNLKMKGGSIHEYTYDAAKNLILESTSEYNTGTQDWQNRDKIEYEFDQENNNTAAIYSDWYAQTNLWVYSYKNVYNFDNAYAITDLISPTEFDEIFKHKLTSFVSYGFVDEDWVQAQDYTVYYTSITATAIGNVDSTLIMVYPNPATDRVVFTNKTSDAATLQLFNQQGTLVLNNAIIMNQPVSIQGMTQGIYFYRISNANAESYNGTLIID